jgi:hypothetical protein
MYELPRVPKGPLPIRPLLSYRHTLPFHPLLIIFDNKFLTHTGER